MYHPFESDIYSLGLIILSLMGATNEEKIIIRKEIDNQIIVLNKFKELFPIVVKVLE